MPKGVDVLPGDRVEEDRPGTMDSEWVDYGWELLDRFRDDIDRARHMSFECEFGGGLEISWEPMSVGHGDLGMALVFSAADQLDADGGWDTVAMEHIRRAAASFQDGPVPGAGLFSGTGALAFGLRALSRGGTRYLRAIGDVESVLETQLTTALGVTEPYSGAATDFYDVVVGISGAVTYVMTTDAHRTALGDTAERAVRTLAELAVAEAPGGLWTPPDKVSELERSTRPELWAGYLNCGFAHGIAGVLNVLGQACDRGIGGPVVAEAAERLADLLVQVSTYANMVDVPAFLPLRSDHDGGPAPTGDGARYAWCYGNLGAALPFHNSRFLADRHPDMLAGLLDISGRSQTSLSLDNPSLCHGMAGKLALEREMLGDHTVPANVKQLLALSTPDRVFGFDNVQLESTVLDSPGFMDGSGGAAVALLSLGAPPDTLHCLRMFTGRWSW
ncbi:lanthionine synthetase LanC family protein [Nocardia sp. NPDC019395]|uniref:lanthionine synthetase LanC family protein n=1 Tax=Nocardia sp. NPDC019395 TaxID=3154686 RepID=UPI0033FCF10B